MCPPVLNAQNKISNALSKRHQIRTVYYDSSDETTMTFYDQNKMGKRRNLLGMHNLLAKMESEGVLNYHKDSITLIVSMNYVSGEVSECIASCNRGLYLVYNDHDMITPSRCFDSIERLVEVVKPNQVYGSTYQEKVLMLLSTLLQWDIQHSIELIKHVGRPGNFELGRDYVWKIIIEDGKIAQDILFAFDPLDLALHQIDLDNLKNLFDK